MWKIKKIWFFFLSTFILGSVSFANELDIIIEFEATEIGQTIHINPYFSNSFTINENNINNGYTFVSQSIGTQTITLSTNENKWKFKQNYQQALIPQNETTVKNVKIISMPSIDQWFASWGNADQSFFSYFNYQWAITGLPEWSFDTSNIQNVQGSFFESFNEEGLLTKLPENSFQTTKIGYAQDNFFKNFNKNGHLATLPQNSFQLQNLRGANNNFFVGFNEWWDLTHLPAWSFQTQNISYASNYFFANFNKNGKLTTLPEGSFQTQQLNSIGTHVFESFNENGNLISLPAWSFQTQHISYGSDSCFKNFNKNGNLETLPEGSFDLSNTTRYGQEVFNGFDQWGKLKRVPDSFKVPALWVDLWWFRNAFTSDTIIENAKELLENVIDKITNPPIYSENQITGENPNPDPLTWEQNNEISMTVQIQPWKLTITSNESTFIIKNNEGNNMKPSFESQEVSMELRSTKTREKNGKSIPIYPFVITDLKWSNKGFYTTIQATDLIKTDASNSTDTNSKISAENIRFTAGQRIKKAEWYDNDKIKINEQLRNKVINSPNTYMYRDEPSPWLIGEYGDEPTITITIPENTPSGIYKWSIIYTLYDADEIDP